MQQVIVHIPDIEGLFPSCLLWKFMHDPVKYLLSVTVIGCRTVYTIYLLQYGKS